jgi:hypothetical protein
LLHLAIAKRRKAKRFCYLQGEAVSHILFAHRLHHRACLSTSWLICTIYAM